jgi:hypothetical protein
MGKFLDGSALFSQSSMELLEELLMRISQLVTDIEHIGVIDINPLVLGDGWAHAANARVTIIPSPVASPMHLVISPYPNEFENKCFREGYGELLIRPIRRKMHRCCAHFMNPFLPAVSTCGFLPRSGIFNTACSSDLPKSITIGKSRWSPSKKTKEKKKCLPCRG